MISHVNFQCIKIHWGWLFLLSAIHLKIKKINAKNAKIAAIVIIITADHTKPATAKHTKPRNEAGLELFLWPHQHDKIPRPKKSTDIGVTI